MISIKKSQIRNTVSQALKTQINGGLVSKPSKDVIDIEVIA